MKKLLIALCFLPALGFSTAHAQKNLPLAKIKSELATKYNTTKKFVRVSGDTFKILRAGGPVRIGAQPLFPATEGNVNRATGRVSHVQHLAIPL